MTAVEIDDLLGVDVPSDAELISAVRDGETEAYGELFARHVDAARRLARQLVSAGDVDDLVSEAFAKVLVVLQRGDGPDLAFRAYLLTAVRRLHVDKVRATTRLQPTDDLTPYDPGVPFHDTAVEGFESAAAAKAFSSLPERWQMVLWHTEVEEMKPADIAPLLGISANSVSALAYRAREGLRQAFVSMHAQDAAHKECVWARNNIGAHIRDGCSRRDSGKVEAHLTDCRPCMAIYLELTEVNSNLRGILGPLVLGGAAAAYLQGAGAVGVTGWLAGGVSRVSQFVRQNPAAAAASGVVATAAVAGSLAMAATGGGEAPEAAPDAPPAAQGGGGGGGGGGGAGGGGAGGGGGGAGGGGDAGGGGGGGGGDTAPEAADDPADAPTSGPTPRPTPTDDAAPGEPPAPRPSAPTPTAGPAEGSELEWPDLEDQLPELLKKAQKILPTYHNDGNAGDGGGKPLDGLGN